MRKINLILFLLIFSIGCSVVRNRESRNNNLSDSTDTDRLLESANNQNITRNDFFIQKAELKITTQDETEKLLATIKFKKPDLYLISIRSRAGIEVARIYLSGDTILINDRINKKQYYGSPEYLAGKYGVTVSVLPVILGDFIEDNMSGSNTEKCLDGKLDINSKVNGTGIKYIIDCKKRKSILAITENSLNIKKIEIRYSDFLKSGDVLFPGKIEIRDFQSNTNIEIKIHRIESPWNGDLEFIPGNKYEIIQLL